jgi:hypothetical protein
VVQVDYGKPIFATDVNNTLTLLFGKKLKNRCVMKQVNHLPTNLKTFGNNGKYYEDKRLCLGEVKETD